MYRTYLKHHGVPGQKWGVRKGPPYPLKDNSGNEKVVDNIKCTRTVVKDSLESGKVSSKVNPNKQKRHIKDDPDYQEGKSYLDGDIEEAQELIDKMSGTGEPISDKKGNWTRKERVKDDKVIGTHIDPTTKVETKTNNGIIVYSKSGAHVIPARKEEKK